jgi:hypothetical protein
MLWNFVGAWACFGYRPNERDNDDGVKKPPTTFTSFLTGVCCGVVCRGLETDQILHVLEFECLAIMTIPSL